MLMEPALAGGFALTGGTGKVAEGSPGEGTLREGGAVTLNCARYHYESPGGILRRMAPKDYLSPLGWDQGKPGRVGAACFGGGRQACSPSMGKTAWGELGFWSGWYGPCFDGGVHRQETMSFGWPSGGPGRPIALGREQPSEGRNAAFVSCTVLVRRKEVGPGLITWGKRCLS